MEEVLFCSSYRRLRLSKGVPLLLCANAVKVSAYDEHIVNTVHRIFPGGRDGLC